MHTGKISIIKHNGRLQRDYREWKWERKRERVIKIITKSASQNFFDSFWLLLLLLSIWLLYAK